MYFYSQQSRCFWNRCNFVWPCRTEQSSDLTVLTTAVCSARELRYQDIWSAQYLSRGRVNGRITDEQRNCKKFWKVKSWPNRHYLSIFWRKTTKNHLQNNRNAHIHSTSLYCYRNSNISVLLLLFLLLVLLLLLLYYYYYYYYYCYYYHQHHHHHHHQQQHHQHHHHHHHQHHHHYYYYDFVLFNGTTCQCG